MKIFVYGTLKRGYGNNRILDNSEFLGEVLTAPNYDLRASGIPFLMHGDYAIRGEVYEAEEAAVHRMDLLEGHPNFYRRGDILLDEGESMEGVQAYFFNEINTTYANLVPLSEDGTKVWGRDNWRAENV